MEGRDSLAEPSGGDPSQKQLAVEGVVMAGICDQRQRDRCGRNWFGQSCLMARRLVEHGVPYVTINYKGWDTHKQHPCRVWQNSTFLHLEVCAWPPMWQDSVDNRRIAWQNEG